MNAGVPLDTLNVAPVRMARTCGLGKPLIRYSLTWSGVDMGYFQEALVAPRRRLAALVAYAAMLAATDPAHISLGNGCDFMAA
jgi:hypothetical protein